MPNPVELHRRAIDDLDATIATIDDADWNRPTACEGWSVRDLLAHLTAEARWAPHLLAGQTLEEVGDRYDGDVLGADALGAWREASAAERAAVDEPAVLTRGVHTTMGTLPAEVYLTQRVTDLVVHRWDLAQGLGTAATPPEDLATPLLDALTPHADELAGSGLFAPPVPVADDAPAGERLLGLLGRDPRRPSERPGTGDTAGEPGASEGDEPGARPGGERGASEAGAPAEPALDPVPVSAGEITFVRTMTQLDANILGHVHGGVIMREVDTAAGAAAARHAGRVCVTAAIDELSFLAPVEVGDLLFVHAAVNDVGRTSLEVGVRVEAERWEGGPRRHTTTAYLVMVCLGDDGQPVAVPPLAVANDEERRRQAQARIRRQMRKERIERLGSYRPEPTDPPTT